MPPRDSLPAPWLLGAAALAGLSAGVLWAKWGPNRAADPGAARDPGAPSAAKPAPATPPVFSLPGGPPPAIARDMEEAILGAFREAPNDPVARVAWDAAFARVRALTGEWAAGSRVHPLAATAWWRAALRRTLPSGEGTPRGVVRASIPFLGTEIPLAFSVPGGAGPFPAVLAVVEGPDPAAGLEAAYGPLLRTHLVAAAAKDETLSADPRLLLRGLEEAARRWPVDPDRVVLDGVGEGAAVAATLAADASTLFCGAVLRSLEPSGPVPEGTGLFPVLAPGVRVFGGLKEASVAWPRVKFLPTDDPAAVREWIASLPPRPWSDPRNPVTWETRTGPLFRDRGPRFVVRQVRDRDPGRTVRVSISRDRERNAVVLRAENVAEILLLLDDDGLDLGQPVKVVVDGMVVEERRVERSLDVVRNWATQGEPTLFVAAELPVRLPE